MDHVSGGAGEARTRGERTKRGAGGGHWSSGGCRVGGGSPKTKTRRQRTRASAWGDRGTLRVWAPAGGGAPRSAAAAEGVLSGQHHQG